MSLIRRVSEEDAQTMLGEISKIPEFFGNHYKGNLAYKDSALKDGKSVWIHDAKHDDAFLMDDKLPFLTSYIRDSAKLLDSNKFGRAYVYNLEPGLEIFEHVDTQDYYKKTKRYHIYFTIPDGVSIKHFGDTIESNTLIFFNPMLPHAYKNDSTEPLIFVVFDTYNP